jgi:uncharacterized phage protein gp47/JayE
VRLLLSIVNKQLDTFYQTLKVQHTSAFLSKAEGNTIDMIGEIVDCVRFDGEDDDDYKYRISKQTLTMEKANETAVRLAVLSAPGVVDVIMREFTHGTGSFSVYPVFDDITDWSDEVIAQIESNLKDTKAYGVKAVVLRPKLAYVEIKGRLVFDKKTSELDRALIQNQATQAVRQYINTLLPGDTIEIFTLRNRVLSLSASIMNMEIYQFTVNGKSMLVVDQESAWNERFTESSTLNAINFA